MAVLPLANLIANTETESSGEIDLQIDDVVTGNSGVTNQTIGAGTNHSLSRHTTCRWDGRREARGWTTLATTTLVDPTGVMAPQKITLLLPPPPPGSSGSREPGTILLPRGVLPRLLPGDRQGTLGVEITGEMNRSPTTGSSGDGTARTTLGGNRLPPLRRLPGSRSNRGGNSGNRRLPLLRLPGNNNNRRLPLPRLPGNNRGGGNSNHRGGTRRLGARGNSGKHLRPLRLLRGNNLRPLLVRKGTGDKLVKSRAPFYTYLVGAGVPPFFLRTVAQKVSTNRVNGKTGLAATGRSAFNVVVGVKGVQKGASD